MNEFSAGYIFLILSLIMAKQGDKTNTVLCGISALVYIIMGLKNVLT